MALFDSAGNLIGTEDTGESHTDALGNLSPNHWVGGCELSSMEWSPGAWGEALAACARRDKAAYDATPAGQAAIAQAAIDQAIADQAAIDQAAADAVQAALDQAALDAAARSAADAETLAGYQAAQAIALAGPQPAGQETGVSWLIQNWQIVATVIGLAVTAYTLTKGGSKHGV